jgi:hypothetical protein
MSNGESAAAALGQCLANAHSGAGVPESVAEALLNHVKGEIEGTYNLYNYWPERKQALGLWHEKLLRLESEARQRAA